MELEAVCTAVAERPLSFTTDEVVNDAPPLDRLLFKTAGPARLGASPLGADPVLMEVAARVSDVTSQVDTLQLAEYSAPASVLLQDLFVAAPTSVLGTTPPSPCGLGRGKGITPMARRSPRVAAMSTSVPVSQRATVRLAHELGAMDKAESSAKKAEVALTSHLKSPLQGVDMDGLAILTRINKDAIYRMASLAGKTEAAAAAN